jgi:RNA polymerase sigma-70 factor, ECF subfamily
VRNLESRFAISLRFVTQSTRFVESAVTAPTASAGDLSALFDRYKERLRRTVRLRLDPRLTGIVDSSGVLKLAREEVDRRVRESSASTAGSFLWLRQVVGEVLQTLHQQRLGPDVRGDISLYRGALPEATSTSLAAHLLGKGATAEDLAAGRAEQKIMLQETLNAMDALDREVLTLRHCEQLSNDETATVLQISSAQASEAYIRALKRISMIVASLPGFKRKGSK